MVAPLDALTFVFLSALHLAHKRIPSHVTSKEVKKQDRTIQQWSTEGLYTNVWGNEDLR